MGIVATMRSACEQGAHSSPDIDVLGACTNMISAGRSSLASLSLRIELGVCPCAGGMSAFSDCLALCSVPVWGKPLPSTS